MRGSKEKQDRTELKELVREASAALARLDAERLEELARCCQALNQDRNQDRNHDRNQNQNQDRKQDRKTRSGVSDGSKKDAIELARQSREAAGEFVIFTRVLEATRANLEVMMRLRAFQQEQLEYGEQTRARHWARPEASDGHN